MTTLRVLLTEDEAGVAAPARDRLVAAGHEVVQCSARSDSEFPCVALADPASCPLRAGVVDVTLAMRRTGAGTPTRREDGALCAVRNHVPLVVASDGGPDPFATWEAAAVGFDADVVAACERAAHRPLPRHSDIARAAAREVVRRATRAGSVVESRHRLDAIDADVRRVDGRLSVHVRGPDATSAVQHMIAVRVTAALRSYDTDARGVDVAFVEPAG
jgi:hypothetical protein